MIPKDPLFSESTHAKLTKNVHQFFQDFLQDMIEDLDDGYENHVLSQDFLPDLKSLLKLEKDKAYNPFQVTWASLIEQVITIAQLHDELEECDDEDEKNDIESDIFDFWNNHEYSITFMEMVEEGKPIATCSETLIGLLENQVLSFHAVHLNKDFTSDVPILYSLNKELGDSTDRFFVDGGNFVVNMDTTQYAALLPISRINHQLSLVEIQDEKDVYLKSLVPLNNACRLHVNSIDLKIHSRDTQTDSRLSEFRENISKALSLISQYSPDCFVTFKSFTHTIVPISDKGIVSYSLQSMPGLSCINMFDRDFVDLIDDLIHENGHHYLNYYLNHLELINEDDEQIFFSPWREALRPIRGLYHAVFTFYWAYKVFGDLTKNLDQIELDSDQKSKVILRYIEEYKMLDFCKAQIEHAYKLDKITESGMALIQNVYNTVQSDRFYPDAVKLCHEKYSDISTELNNLDSKLAKWKKEYLLS
jgi:hypothetical protein